MEDNSWVKLYRKLLEWEWWGDKNTTCLFLYLLLRANWKDTSWRGIEVKKGSLITSTPSLMRDLKMTERETKTALKHLEKTGEIVRQTTHRYSLISVKNFESYQDERPTNVRQTSDKGLQIKKERKKEGKK